MLGCIWVISWGNQVWEDTEGLIHNPPGDEPDFGILGMEPGLGAKGLNNARKPMGHWAGVPVFTPGHWEHGVFPKKSGRAFFGKVKPPGHSHFPGV